VAEGPGGAPAETAAEVPPKRPRAKRKPAAAKAKSAPAKAARATRTGGAFMGQSNRAPGLAPRALNSQSFLDAESRALLSAPGTLIPSMIDPPEHIIPAPLTMSRSSTAGMSFRFTDLLCR